MKLIEQLYIDIPKSEPRLYDIVIYNLLNPGYRVMYYYRLAKYCSTSNFKIVRIYSSRLRAKMITKRNCDISSGSIIGRNFRLAHPLGVVIGAGAIIKDNVTIFQNVTLGSHGREEKEYPIIESGAIIYAGAVIIGGVTIGENAIVGANTVINKDVPSNHVAYGNPLQIKPKKLK
jgi:serine O-acetyltransferase